MFINLKHSKKMYGFAFETNSKKEKKNEKDD